MTPASPIFSTRYRPTPRLAAFTRRDLERLLGVRRRRAILLLHRMDAKRQGSELTAPRESVIRYLEECWSDEAAARADAQERQVAQTLAGAL